MGEYKVAAGGDATPGAWTLEGADAGSFTLTGSGTTRMLEFGSSPDYDAMADADGDNMYEVTLKVSDSINSETYDTFAVTVTVTDVDELGVLSGSKTASVNEGDTDLGTYTLTGGPAAYTYLKSLEGDDAGQFTLNAIGTTGVLELSFSSAPDYEAPADADGDNTYEVTVKATAGGEETMVAVTVTVDNVNELGTLAGNASPTYAEDRTDAVGTYMLSGGTMDDMAEWTLSGDDADAFTIPAGVLEFSSAPDYEDPNGRRRQRLQHLHGHRQSRGRRRNEDGGSRNHRRQRGRGRSDNPGYRVPGG